MKKKIVIIGILFGLIGVVGAQRMNKEQNPKDRVEAKTERMVECLELTESQAKELRQLNAKFAKKQEETRESHKAAMEKLLTPEQAQKWKEMRNTKRVGKGDRGRMDKGQRAAMLEKRKAFDKKLSAAEKATIAKFKADFDKEAMRKDRASYDNREEAQAAMKEKFAPILKIADKYKDELAVVCNQTCENQGKGKQGRSKQMKGGNKDNQMKRVRFLLMPTE